MSMGGTGYGVQYAGEYKLKRLDLISSSNGRINLSGLTTEINIFENIFLNTLTASLMVVDTADLINNIGIQGQEFVEMEIETPSLEDFNYVLTFSLYKVGAREDVNSGGALYEFSLVTPEFLLNHRRRISKSYEGNISTIVKDILENPLYIQTEKKLFIEPTKGIRKIVSPNLHPYTLIKNLATEAQSLKSSSPHYLFFENLRGLHFISLQELYNQPSLGEYKVIHAGQLKENNTINVDEQLKTVIDYNITGNNDTFVNIKSGMLGSTVITHDIYNKSYSKNTYSYFDDFNKYQRIDANPIYDDVKGIGNFTDARLYVNPTSTTTDFQDAQHYGTSATSNQLSETLLHRQARLAELGSAIKVQMTVHGNTTLVVGQKIIFNKPSNSEIEVKVDPYYQGEFLVTQTRHRFSQVDRRHEIIFSAAKDSIPLQKETK
jgi:hypothetical protein|tara:strand:+ start:48 stop:1349 length:1302 start_codon:yes stop_codon:yes gene_type:complete